jgi:potassium/hydrogen antiporter
MPEITDYATIVLVIAGGFAVAVLATRIISRVPVPGAAILLVAAAVLSDLVPGLDDHVEIRTVERVAVAALIVILLDGGIGIGWRRIRESAAPVLSVGLLGTFATAGLLALVAHAVLGFDWTTAGLLGAALAPTDPAVMFSVLGGREVQGRSGTILEGEAGVNDPAGIALMLGMIELATHDDATFWAIPSEFLVEMVVGGVGGLIGARLALALLARVRLPSEALHGLLVLTLAGALYGAVTLATGSGFLAVFVLGLKLGDADEQVLHHREITQLTGALSTAAELVVFVALGLTVHLGGLTGDDWLDGIVLAVAMAVVIRPAVVAVTLAPVTLTAGERAFIAWSGLKGAVPILLAAFALIAGVDHGPELYDVVFIVVLLSVVVQGTLVPAVGARTGVARPQPDSAP